MGFTMKRMAKESNSNPRMHEIGDAKHLEIDFLMIDLMSLEDIPVTTLYFDEN